MTTTGPPSSSAAGEPILKVRHLSKSFGEVRVLRDVDLSVLRGEIHALAGHNGSGKSTLVKILSGFHSADPASVITIAGVALDNKAAQLNVRFVHQDLGLVLQLSAAENLTLHASGNGAHDRASRRVQTERIHAILRDFGTELDVRTPLSEATPVQRVMVAIAIALEGLRPDNSLIVLDEPTAVLPPHEVDHLQQILRSLRLRGTAILYVSHRLEEIISLADRVTVLRNGACVATIPVPGMTKAALVDVMLGEHVQQQDVPTAGREQLRRRPALLAENLTGAVVRGVSFHLHEGEILGVAGLPGSGCDEVPYIIAGYPPAPAAGSISVPGVGERRYRAAEHVRAGIGFVPADRATEGAISQMSVSDNLTLSTLSGLRTHGWLSRATQRGRAAEWLDRLDIGVPGPDSRMADLSGGNQQKVLIARCLERKPKVIILCEPTAGVDIAARAAIHQILADQAARGVGIIVTSTDISELSTLCHRILVFRDGVIARELSGEGITDNAIIRSFEDIKPGASV